jgi:hypothetical protein
MRRFSSACSPPESLIVGWFGDLPSNWHSLFRFCELVSTMGVIALIDAPLRSQPGTGE